MSGVYVAVIYVTHVSVIVFVSLMKLQNIHCHHHDKN